ncbi:PQQ-dependent sugar dehydrogenase [Spirosoma utsteinense]|uniref:Glucose/arabinose dehydrogenase n=1 Tax=Spirosoma utsteinense TaxID=2585773 RepID=A0ABR6VZ86_9BACT|nr:sorbosone dehydrogenase family protein [Spirosoma utsteinense]MBC3784618.1 glucose/arabinose dehydrogenase [Spirosoma utsteinense]MBC3789629.1 glucose/arabinose dehydrogenase [Spirosoma utsteinense]
MKTKPIVVVALIAMMAACGPKKEEGQTGTTVATTSEAVNLPAPYTTKSSVRYSNVVGWSEGKTPQAPEGFTVTEYARDLTSPRWMYAAPNGDVFVAEANTEPKTVKKKVVSAVSGQNKSQPSGESANRITLLRDTNKDGKPDVRETFITGLNQPFGMLVLGNSFYAANTDGLMQYPYQAGQTKITAPGKKILELPAGGYNNHWTRNLLAGPDGKKIYISVGSGSNVGENGMENEVRRANILEVNPDGTGERVYASGLRNPVGMDWQPTTNTLYAAVNERDELGDDLVPDYLTSVKEGAFYGWPYAYFGQHEDPRRKGERLDLVKKTVTPDVPLGSHTASLGLAFYDGTAFPAKYRNGAFIGQHGSWNRSEFSGYKVVFVPFENGKPGKPEDFLTGFVAGKDKDVYGRPVGVTVLPDGSMLVADDAAGRIWRIAAN